MKGKKSTQLDCILNIHKIPFQIITQTDGTMDNPIYAVAGQTFHIIMDIEILYNEHDRILTAE